MKQILRKTAAVLLIFAMVLCTVPVSASAANYKNFYAGDTLLVKVEGGINMRTQPTTSSAVRVCIPYGKYVSVLTVGNGSNAPLGWIRVSYGSANGWVYAGNDGWFEALAPKVYSYPANKQASVTATDGLQVHSTPYLRTNNVLFSLPYKAVVDLVGYTKNGITQISYTTSGKTYSGYVSTKYLSTPVDKVIKETFKKIYGYTAEVSGDIAAVNVRTGANTTSTVLTTLASGQLAPIISESDNYYKVYVTVDGKKKKGYVSKNYTSKVDSLTESISLNRTKKTVYVGKKYTLKVSNPANLAITTTWKTSNKSIATVSTKGVVKGKKAGKATITCTVKAGKRTRTIQCNVTVKKPKTT